MLTAYLWGCLTVVLMMVIIWLIHLPLKNAAIVDMGWGLGFILMTLIFVSHGAGWTLRNQIIFVLVALWGVRIMLYVFFRILVEKREDKRYTEFRRKWGNHIEWNFLRIFEIQAFLQMVIVLPILVMAFNADGHMHWLEWTGFSVALISIICEAVADEQLRSFKGNMANKGKTCQTGFWYYSRHPNYFFEILVWVAIYVAALPTAWGWATIASPLMITYLILNVSGIPLAEEQSLRSRGDEYRDYQRTTSILIPLPKKG